MPDGSATADGAPAASESDYVPNSVEMELMATAMAETKKPKSDTVGKSTPARRKRASTRKKTRDIALEQRVVFDGALGADVVDRLTQAPVADVHAADGSTATNAESTTPAMLVE